MSNQCSSAGKHLSGDIVQESPSSLESVTFLVSVGRMVLVPLGLAAVGWGSVVRVLVPSS